MVAEIRNIDYTREKKRGGYRVGLIRTEAWRGCPGLVGNGKGA